MCFCVCSHGIKIETLFIETSDQTAWDESVMGQRKKKKKNEEMRSIDHERVQNGQCSLSNGPNRVNIY